MAERQRIMESAWAASRARMLRWGDHSLHLESAIKRQGRPALCRTTGMSTTVIGRMLRYHHDQPVKPESIAMLMQGIARLESALRDKVGPVAVDGIGSVPTSQGQSL